jgi:8-oxo-dGTP pyrophosphatase MutT (NUDIX family)
MDTRQELVAALKIYESSYNEESKFVPKFLKLLEHPRSFYKDHLPGHITGSAFIIDRSGKFTLLTLHAKLHQWLQPGGHADGEENVLNVALRETQEETGIKLPEVTPGIFDIDIHPIPAFKGFPEHDHYDIRFLFKVSMEQPIKISEESTDLAWKPLHELPMLTKNNRSMVRMAEKVNALF